MSQAFTLAVLDHPGQGPKVIDVTCFAIAEVNFNTKDIARFEPIVRRAEQCDRGHAVQQGSGHTARESWTGRICGGGAIDSGFRFRATPGCWGMGIRNRLGAGGQRVTRT